jgi:hypothetical protein
MVNLVELGPIILAPRRMPSSTQAYHGDSRLDAPTLPLQQLFFTHTIVALVCYEETIIPGQQVDRPLQQNS